MGYSMHTPSPKSIGLAALENELNRVHLKGKMYSWVTVLQVETQELSRYLLSRTNELDWWTVKPYSENIH